MAVHGSNIIEVSAEGDSPIPIADRQALRENLLEGLIRHTFLTALA